MSERNCKHCGLTESQVWDEMNSGGIGCAHDLSPKVRTARSLIAHICNQRRNSDIRADDGEILGLVNNLLEEINALPDKKTLTLLSDSFLEIARCQRCKSCAWNAQSAVGNLERFL